VLSVPHPQPWTPPTRPPNSPAAPSWATLLSSVGALPRIDW